jgi:hypothetical protein
LRTFITTGGFSHFWTRGFDSGGAFLLRSARFAALACIGTRFVALGAFAATAIVATASTSAAAALAATLVLWASAACFGFGFGLFRLFFGLAEQLINELAE